MLSKRVPKGREGFHMMLFVVINYQKILHLSSLIHFTMITPYNNRLENQYQPLQFEKH